MKKFLITIVLTLLLSVGSAFALEMPEISVNSVAMYSLETEDITVAPTVGATVVSYKDGLVTGNFQVAFPTSDRIESDIIGGPMVWLDMAKLLTGKDVVISKELKLKIGTGAMFDVFHLRSLNWQDLKGIIYPSAGLGLEF